MSERRGILQKRIILLLQAGITLGLTYSAKRHFRILKDLSKEWNDIDRLSLRRSIHTLDRAGLVTAKKGKNLELTLELTKKGNSLAKALNLETVIIKKPRKWDGLWRVVMFDIPEPRKKARDALRFHLKKLGFRELQKSVFIIPHPCIEEIEQIASFYNIGKYIHFLVATRVSNEKELRNFFTLL